MIDKYRNFEELKRARPKSFRINMRSRESQFLLFAPHAGGIEPGTSEICKWFNKEPYSYYIFEGIGKTAASYILLQQNLTNLILSTSLAKTDMLFHFME